MKFCFLCFLLSVQVFGLELSYAEQAKLIKVLLSNSGQAVTQFDIGVIGGSEEEAKQIMDALQIVSPLKINDKELPVSIKRQTGSDSAHIYYLLPGAEPLNTAIAFAGSREMVEKGVLVGLVLEGTVPRIYMNLHTLKALGIQFPSSLLSMVSFVK